MADLFGEWVPWEWIGQVMDVVRRSPDWNFIFLTKNPEKFLSIEWPRNTWAGATADTHDRAVRALRALREMAVRKHAGEKGFPEKTFLSCEPLLGGIDFQAMNLEGGRLSDLIDWIIIGGQSRTSAVPALQPEWEWVEKILVDGHQEGLPVYFKPNLLVRPQEYPR
jgi:protein gp37